MTTGAWGEGILAMDYDAIAIAERTGRLLSKYGDPIEGARTGLTLEEAREIAREIAREDPSLIYLLAWDHWC